MIIVLCILNVATVLTVNDHLRHVKGLIWDARRCWRNIGRALDLSDYTIDSIREPDDGESLHKVLKTWMESGKATISDLINALEDHTVGHRDIANKIRSLKDEGLL